MVGSIKDLGAKIKCRRKKMNRCKTQGDLGNYGFVKRLSHFESYVDVDSS